MAYAYYIRDIGQDVTRKHDFRLSKRWTLNHNK